MNLSNIPFTVVVSVALQDAGEATRSLEIMNGVRAIAPSNYTIRVIFFSHGSKFDKIWGLKSFTSSLIWKEKDTSLTYSLVQIIL
jgi:hypothetical protein